MTTELSTALLAISPLDGRYQQRTLPLQNYFSEYALFHFRFIVEIKWLHYLLSHAELLKITPPSTAALQILSQKAEQFTLEDALAIKKMEQQCNHDVKAVEYFLKAYLTEQPELTTYQEWVHFGCTSEDINNLAYGLIIQHALQKVIYPKLNDVLAILKSYAHEYAAMPMLARTHGQAATPTTVGKEFANFAYRLERHLQHLTALPILGKFNGAVGNYNAAKISLEDVPWPTFNQTFVEQLGLTWNPYTTQIEPHDYLATLLAQFSTMHSVLIDCARDCWSYISIGYFDQRLQSHEIGSSTMPHKVNPIDFENAEGNLSLSQGIAQFLAGRLPISRYQRDLVDSTLLRNVGTVFGYSLIAYDALCAGLKKITPNQPILKQDLANHPEVLAEAIQTIMRVHGLKRPYEQLKALTRGQKIDEATLTNFIEQLTLPEPVKQQLLQLRPSDYLGYAEKLSKTV